MSDNPGEKRPGFERWVASLKLGAALKPSSQPPPPEDADGTPLTLDEQATLINRIPKEVIYKLRERDSQRAGMPKNDDSTAVFTPPPELLARAKRFQAPPKPERSSPNASEIPTSRPPPMPFASPIPDLAAAEAAAFAGLGSDEEATTFFKPDLAELHPPSIPPAPLGDLSRPGDIQWIDGLASSPPGSAPQAFVTSAGDDLYPSTEPAPGSQRSAHSSSSIAPSEQRLRWIAILVALLMLGGIYMLSRMQ